MRSRIAVLASGGGSNVQAILDYFDRVGEGRAGDVTLVASDRAQAGALERGARRGIRTAVLPTPGRHGGGPSLERLIDEEQIDLIALAGYLRLVPDDIVRRFDGRIVNVHPALLPAFGGLGMYGDRVHEAVLNAGVAVTGATVHFVDEIYDRGRIIAQWPVPVLRGDEPRTLGARVLRVEHILYPRVLHAVAAGDITLSSSSLFRASTDADVAFTLASREDRCLADEIERALDS